MFEHLINPAYFERFAFLCIQGNYKIIASELLRAIPDMKPIGLYLIFNEPEKLTSDILGITDRILVEHWDVIQDEATQEQSKSGLPMFGHKFPNSSGRMN
jgi:hypothetical protein